MAEVALTKLSLYDNGKMRTRWVEYFDGLTAATTDESIQDVIGGIVGASLTYNDATPSINTIQDIQTTASPTFATTTLTNLTATRVLFAGASKQITDDGDMTFATDTLTVTKLSAPTSVDTPLITTTADLTVTCGTDKTLTLTETVWDDLRIFPGSFDRPGVEDPTIVAYDVNGGGTNTYLWQFQKNAIASFTVQLPHGYKVGTDITVHIHWTPGPRGNEENAAMVGWKVDYSWANIDGTFGTMATADLSDACDGTDHKHQMTPEVTIDGHTAAKGISSMLLCNVKRTDTGTDDTWAGTTSGQLPMLLEIDFHYQIDTIGSRQQSAK